MPHSAPPFRNCVSSRLSGWLALIAGVMLLSGCGTAPPTGRVSGMVYAEAGPVAGGIRVGLMSLKTGYVDATDIQENGTFHFRKPVPVGEYTVFVTEKLKDEEPPDGELRLKADASESVPSLKLAKQQIPARFWNEATSDLLVQVEPGDNQLALNLLATQ